MNRHERIMSLDKLPDNVDKKKIDEIFDDYYKKLAKEREKTMSCYKKDDKVLALLTVKDVDWSQSNMNLPYKLRTNDGNDVWVSEKELRANFNDVFESQDKWEEPVSYDDLFRMQNVQSRLYGIWPALHEVTRQVYSHTKDDNIRNKDSWNRVLDQLNTAKFLVNKVTEFMELEREEDFKVVKKDEESKGTTK